MRLDVCLVGGGMDVLALCETKMKGKEVAFGEVPGECLGLKEERERVCHYC